MLMSAFFIISVKIGNSAGRSRYAAKQRIEDGLSSEEYRVIEGLRLSSVYGSAVIVESEAA